MIGEVDEAERALLELSIQNSPGSDVVRLVVWIDTAFDGELVVSLDDIQSMQLTQAAAISATLADGTVVILETYDCFVEWFGKWRSVQVIANEGDWALLGTALLRDRQLIIDYRAKSVVLE